MNLSVTRKQTRPVDIGAVRVGGGAPVVVQSMTCTDTRDVDATVAQIGRLQDAGCEIVRVAVPDRSAAKAVRAIHARISMPLVADIHFDPRLALAAMDNGADGIRINPGNMRPEGIREVVSLARERGVAIRLGVNAGSLEKDLLAAHRGPTAEALVASALRHVRRLEDMDFFRIKLSLKSSHVPTMVAAYRTVARQTDYPLHVGVTEAGTLLPAAVKSSVGIGILLSEGIGDTIRVSVTGDPVAEMPVAYGILRALGIRCIGPEIIACPTCGRCEIDLPGLVGAVERELAGMRACLKIALMGCVVNGPGEAREADVGIAGGRGGGVLFRKGAVVRKVKEADMVSALLAEVRAMAGT